MIRYLDGRQVTDAAGVTRSGIAGNNRLVLVALAVSAFVIVIAVVYYSRMAGV